MERTQTITAGLFIDTKTRDLILTGILILIPLAWNGPQLMIGSIVNMLLCLTAKTSQAKSWWIKAALPSLAVIIHGVLFGSFTIYLFYLWPIITLGNWVYMRIGKSNLRTHKVSKLLVASAIKMLILITGATLLSHQKIIPIVMVKSMGMIQFITAMIGGLMASL